jgi:hypothetical protein
MNLDRLEEYLIKIMTQLASNTKSLEDHIRRTEAAEKNLKILESRMLVQERVILRAQGAVMLFGFLSTVSSLTVVALQIF